MTIPLSVPQASRPLTPVRAIQQDIRELEATIDNAIITGCDMLSKMIRTARAAGLSMHDGHPALVSALEGLHLAGAARAKALDTHEALRRAAGKMDLRTLGWGGFGDSPPAPSGAAVPGQGIGG